MGLETNKRGMNIAQNSLYITGHNVANANTLGYSRQRVNQVQSMAFPTPGISAPRIPGQLGTGVEAGSIQRIRDAFLDKQYRSQNSQMGYYGALSESLIKMEEIMNDPTDRGLLSVMNGFWNALEDVTKNTDNAGARSVVASKGQMLADTFKYVYNSLTNVKNDLGYQIGVKESQINNLIENINRLNEDISKVEPNGLIPNDLYDKRDALVDELSSLVNIKVTATMPTNYGIVDRSVAEGLYNIEIVQDDGSSYSPPLTVVGANHTGLLGTKKLEVQYDGTTNAVSGIKIGNQILTDYSFAGELSGLIESYGYIAKDSTGNTIYKEDALGNPILDGNGNPIPVVKGRYPEMLEKLNHVAKAFVDEFNLVHSDGVLPDGTKPAYNFFEYDTASGNVIGTLKVNDIIIKDPSKIALGDPNGTGAASDNINAHNLAAIQFKDFSKYDPSVDVSNLSGSLDTYYAGIIGNLGVDSASVQKDFTNAGVLRASVENSRQSVSAVSLDEEMTDMIRFQQAYNASARMVTLFDEMLDKIINGMGVVGR